MNSDLQTKIEYNKVIDMAFTDPKGLVEITEGKYVDSIRTVSKKIANNIAQKKVILVTGPSASGKTTTSHILQQQLEERGIASIVVSMDDFFVNREFTPLLLSGEKDYENIKALNIELFKQCIDGLLIDRRCMMPVFDFVNGKRTDNAYELTIGEHAVIIIEGIHAFNPMIISDTMEDKFYRLFVCANSDFVSDDRYISAERLRFVRRLVRDYHNRGSDVGTTERMWSNVRAGEETFILPYKNLADIVIDTTHLYEPFLYRAELEKLALTDDRAKAYLHDFGVDSKFDKSYISEDALVWEFLTRD